MRRLTLKVEIRPPVYEVGSELAQRRQGMMGETEEYSRKENRMGPGNRKATWRLKPGKRVPQHL